MFARGTELLIATIVMLLIVAFIEWGEWRQPAQADGRISAKMRGLFYVTGFGCALFLLLSRDAVHATTIYLIFVGIAALLIVSLLYVLARAGASLNRVFKDARELDDAGRTLDAIAMLETYRAKARRWSKAFEAVLLCNIAGLYAKLRDWQRALAMIDEAIAAAPQEASAYATKASILVACGQKEPAVQIVEAVLPRFEKSVQLQTALAEVQMELGRTKEAATTIDRIDQLLDDEKSFVDVLDRDEWREFRIEPLRSKISGGSAQIIRSN
jgi:tetratricopeptide (TPR) repeat protein